MISISLRLYLHLVVDPCDDPCVEVLFREFSVDQFDPLLQTNAPADCRRVFNAA